MSLVPSVEPSSTTMISSCGLAVCAASAVRHRSSPDAPFSEQMTTLRSADIERLACHGLTAGMVKTEGHRGH